jgi:hypothetical protein
MFNYYQYESKIKQAEQHDELHMLEAQKKLRKILCKKCLCYYQNLEERDEMSKKYRERVGKFVKQVRIEIY